MSGNKVHVDHDAMNLQAKRLTDARAELAAQLASIRAQIDELVNSGFVTVSASDSFNQAHFAWNKAAQECIAELDVMGSYLNKTSDAFAGVDSAVTVKL